MDWTLFAMCFILEVDKTARADEGSLEIDPFEIWCPPINDFLVREGEQYYTANQRF